MSRRKSGLNIKRGLTPRQPAAEQGGFLREMWPTGQYQRQPLCSTWRLYIMNDRPIVRFAEALSDSREFRLVTPKIETSLSGRVRQQRDILHNFRVHLWMERRYAPTSHDSNPPKPLLTAQIARSLRMISKRNRVLQQLIQQMPPEQRQKERASVHYLKPNTRAEKKVESEF